MSEPARIIRPSSPRTLAHTESPSPMVLVVGSADPVASRVRSAMLGIAEVVRVSLIRDARAMLLRSTIHALIVEQLDGAGARTAPLVEETRRDFPRTAILGCVPGRRSLSPESLELIRAGAHDVVVADDIDLRAVVRQIVASARLSCLTDCVWPLIEPSLDPVLAPCFRLALKSSTQPLDVAQIAGALGVSRKTLWERCVKRGLPVPRVLFGWCRVLAAAFALDEPGRKVDSIADELEFPSPSALRNLLQRYLKLTPSELRARGASAYAAAQLVQLLRRNRDVA